jgi:hypothetical protein
VILIGLVLSRQTGRPDVFLRALYCWASAFVFLFIPQLTLADLTPLNGAAVAPNIVEITVLEDGVVVALEVYVGDFETFRELLPDEFLNSDTSRRPSLSERLRKFSAEGLQVIADDVRLQAELLLAEPRRRVDRSAALATSLNSNNLLPTPESPKDKRVLYVKLKYPFETRPDETHPDTLVFIPPTKPNGTAEVNIGFIAFHETVPVIDFRYLSSPATLRLDWEDPWYTRFDNKNLKRHHASALMTFLYVEPREVRHETLIRVRDLENWLDLGVSKNKILGAEAQKAVKESARTFFTAMNPVEINGKPVKATSSRVEFLTVSSSGLQIVEDGDDLDLPNAILGVILSFPVQAIPKKVTVEWELFSERQTSIQATATDPAGPFLNLISADTPMFKWNNYLRTYKEPVVTAVVIPVQNTFQLPLLSVGLAFASIIAAGLSIGGRAVRRIVLLGSAGVGLTIAVLTTSTAVISISNLLDRLPDAETSSRIFTAVLENVNTANLETNSERRNRELETVVSTDALRDVTGELDRALAIKVAGGGLARVDSVEDVVLQDIRSLENGSGFQAVASWRARASAGHWGHTH